VTTQVHTLIGAYALDAVDDDEREMVERHLTDCASCREELREFRATAVRLADYVMVEPPERLRTAILGRINRTRQSAPSSSRSAAEILQPRRIAPWRRALVAVGVIMVVALTSGLVTFSLMRSQVDDQRNQLTQMEAVLTAEDAQFSRQLADGGGEVSMVSSLELDQAVVILSGLQQIALDQAYQLWLVTGDQPVSVGVIEAGHNSAMQLVTDLAGADILGVTTEPAGGSQVPTTPMLAGMELPR